VQYALREYEAAKASYIEALAIRRRALPKDHPDIATSLNNLGVVQQLTASASADIVVFSSTGAWLEPFLTGSSAAASKPRLAATAITPNHRI